MSLKELVVCKFVGCNQVYNDPRMLPCGKRTCAAHIDAMVVDSEDMSNGHWEMTKCHFCQEIHSFPEDGKGFPVDDLILQLLNMSYSFEHDAAKKSFNEVTRLLEKLNNQDSEYYVIDYFQQVEADILLDKEINMRKLVTFYEELVDKAHARKIECLNNLRMNKEELDSKLEKNTITSWSIEQAEMDSEQPTFMPSATRVAKHWHLFAPQMDAYSALIPPVPRTAQAASKPAPMRSYSV